MGFNFNFYGNYAVWDTTSFLMMVSDGTKNVGVNSRTGAPTTPDPKGNNTRSALDIIGHEMSHGVVESTTGLSYGGEFFAINESTADFMGSMIEAYATRPAGADAVIPETGNDWLIGAQTTDQPVRSMINPNSDGISPNNWYNGILYLDSHYSSGPMNRFFYFLSKGASSDKASPAYSVYLPEGMTGIGSDKAAHIWYTALTEWLTSMDGYAGARIAGINAAIELYGEGSTEVAAVKRAFAAINVGTTDDTPPVTIDFAVAQPAGSVLNPMGDSGLERLSIVAMGTTVNLAAEVRNTTDTRVSWKLGGLAGDYNNPGFSTVGGTVTADGGWSPDTVWGFHSMTVVSKADPLQYAEGALWVVDGDADADTEFDAIDLGQRGAVLGPAGLGQLHPLDRGRRMGRQLRRRSPRPSLQERVWRHLNQQHQHIMNSRLLLSFLFTATLAGCGGGSSTPPAAPPPRRSSRPRICPTPIRPAPAGASSRMRRPPTPGSCSTSSVLPARRRAASASI